jgi:hypothetical protein
MTEPDPVLSPAGAARRDAILALALRRVRLRRRVRRAAGVVAVLALLVAVLAPLLPAPAGAAPGGGGIARIATTSDAVARIAPLPRSATSAETWEVLDDQALLAALRDAGRPATLSRSAGRARVVFADGGE